MCNHTLEHVIRSYKAVEEIKRVAKNRVIITVPRQRYSKYTFDLHINFYPQKIDLIALMDIEYFTCVDSDGDWSFIGLKKRELL